MLSILPVIGQVNSLYFPQNNSRSKPINLDKKIRKKRLKTGFIRFTDNREIKCDLFYDEETGIVYESAPKFDKPHTALNISYFEYAKDEAVHKYYSIPVEGNGVVFFEVMNENEGIVILRSLHKPSDIHIKTGGALGGVLEYFYLAREGIVPQLILYRTMNGFRLFDTQSLKIAFGEYFNEVNEYIESKDREIRSMDELKELVDFYVSLSSDV
ncbi:hypothetical protein [Fulvivirga sp.]|uniref:hypothetical protein n=1 Tax=Fulvivirga sp. TaxID=1931237 RepID=UPI0032EA9A07